MKKISNKFKAILKPRVKDGETVVLAIKHTGWLHLMPLLFIVFFVIIMAVVNQFAGVLKRDMSDLYVKVYFISFFTVVALLLIWSIKAKLGARNFYIAFTTHKIIMYDGIIPLEIEYSKLEDCTITQSFLGKIFNYGDLNLYNKTDAHYSYRAIMNINVGNVRVIPDLPNPRFLKNVVLKMIKKRASATKFKR